MSLHMPTIEDVTTRKVVLLSPLGLSVNRLRVLPITVSNNNESSCEPSVFGGKGYFKKRFHLRHMTRANHNSIVSLALNFLFDRSAERKQNWFPYRSNSMYGLSSTVESVFESSGMGVCAGPRSVADGERVE